MKRFIGILQFMTRIPIPIDTGFDEDFHKGIIYFPLVGLILGLCYGVIGLIGIVGFNPYLAAVMILVGEVLLTGGLHLDGLGDTFDGLYSYRDKDRILEIMKDSRLGTNGLLAIVLVFMLKVGFIYECLTQRNLMVIVLMPVVARTMQVFACYKTKTPRENGMGNIFIGKVSKGCLIGAWSLLGIILLIVVSCHGYFEGYSFLSLGMDFNRLIVQAEEVCIRNQEWLLNVLILTSSIFVLTIIMKGFIKSVYRKIDGITGDILGCICELSELVFLMLFYIFHNIFL